MRVDDREVEERLSALVRLRHRFRELGVLAGVPFGVGPVPGPELELRKVADRVRKRSVVAFFERGWRVTSSQKRAPSKSP